MTKRICVLLVALAWAGCQARRGLRSEQATPSIEPIQELSRLFDYDQNSAVDVKEKSVENRDGVRVIDISYASPKGGRVTGYLVVPSRQGPLAGILYMHPAGEADRNTFLPEAILLAKSGAVCLLIDAPFARPAPWGKPAFDFAKPEADRDMFIQTIIDLRRGVDLLASRQDVDPKRLGYVGFSFGGTIGGVLAGLERRVKAYALQGGGLQLTEFWRSRADAPQQQMDRYVQITAPFDAINYIGHASPSALLFQFGRKDPNCPEQDALKYYEAASEPKVLSWYEGGHELNVESLRQRVEWLHREIAIGLPDAAEVERIRY